jgi:hypothetical protein
MGLTTAPDYGYETQLRTICPIGAGKQNPDGQESGHLVCQFAEVGQGAIGP